MFGKIIDVGIAKLCAMCATPNHNGIFKNNQSSGGSTQVCYTAYGSGIITSDAGNAVYEENVLTDVSHVRGHQMNGVAGPNGTIWVGINPVDEKEIEYDYIDTPRDFSFTGVKDVTILLCLRGKITANEKEILDLFYSVIEKDKTVNISVPEGSTAILFWLK